jgi:hypothetical protein
MPALALQWGFSWPVPRWRLAIAVLILGSTLAAAAILHGINASQPTCPRGFICPWGTGPEPFSRHPIYPRPGWGDPIALAVCFLGFALAAAALLPSRRRAAAAVVLGGALSAATILYFQNQLVSQDCPRYPQSPSYPSRCSGPLGASWFGGLVHFHDPASRWRPAAVFHPAAIAVVLLGVAGAVFILLAARGPLSSAALILGAALLSAAVLQVVAYPRGYFTCDSYYAGVYPHPPSRPECVQVEGRRWVDPASLALCVLGVAGAASLLVTARRGNPQ